MGLFSTLKTNARRAMAGGWGKAVAILLIGAIPVLLARGLEFALRMAAGVAEFVDYSGTAGLAFDDVANLSAASLVISLLMGLLLLIVTAPLAQGISRWFYRRTAGEQEGVSTIFHYFETRESYFRALWLRVQIGLRLTLWAFLLSLPLVGLQGFAVFYRLRLGGAAAPAFMNVFLELLVVVWSVVMAILWAIVGLRYLLAPYLLAEHPDWKARRAVRESVKQSRGEKGSLFTFGLTFAGWWAPALASALLLLGVPFSGPLYLSQIIGAIVTLLCLQGLLLLYAAPYMRAAYAMYARYLIRMGETAQADLTKEYIHAAEALLPEQDAPERSE